MMKSFKELISEDSYRTRIEFPSVVASSIQGQKLYLKFDTKDKITQATYEGKSDPWLSSLCYLLPGKTLNDAIALSWKDWEGAFSEDQIFWDLKQDCSSQIFFPALELLRAALDNYRGRDYLYFESSPLICRCFGVRENDVLEYLNKSTEPTLAALSLETKAGMGCRSCVPQLKRWMALHGTETPKHFYKERSYAEWLLEIDYHLSKFPESQDWQMDVESFKDNHVIISFDKNVSQIQEEDTATRLQLFLSGAVDPDLGFFLRRSRQRSNA